MWGYPVFRVPTMTSRSDHLPILLDMEQQQECRRPANKIARYEIM
jgi:hypothetical protein